MTSGKIAFITGANSGIGLATAKILARKGWNILLLCRKQAAAEATIAALKQANPAIVAKYFLGDLADFASLQRVAAQVLAEHPQIDALINNAGYYPDKIEYVDGIEKALYASHLGHMLLTRLLMPALERAPEARIINVSSTVHSTGAVERFFTQPQGHSSLKAYGDAKLANILFTKGLAKRLPAHITTYSLHPGVVHTNFAADGTGPMGFMVRIFGRFLMTPENGAATSVYLATEGIDALKGHSGDYFDKKKVTRIRNKGVTPEHAEWLWTKSEELLKKWA